MLGRGKSQKTGRPRGHDAKKVGKERLERRYGFAKRKDSSNEATEVKEEGNNVSQTWENRTSAKRQKGSSNGGRGGCGRFQSEEGQQTNQHEKRPKKKR